MFDTYSTYPFLSWTEGTVQDLIRSTVSLMYSLPLLPVPNPYSMIIIKCCRYQKSSVVGKRKRCDCSRVPNLSELFYDLHCPCVPYNYLWVLSHFSSSNLYFVWVDCQSGDIVAVALSLFQFPSSKEGLCIAVRV